MNVKVATTSAFGLIGLQRDTLELVCLDLFCTLSERGCQQGEVQIKILSSNSAISELFLIEPTVLKVLGVSGFRKLNENEEKIY